MPRGERIGDAYVRIHADGGGLDREVGDRFSELDPVMETHGKRHGKAWKKGFEDEVDKQGGLHRVIERIQGQLNEGIGRFDAGNKWIKEWDKNLIKLRQMIAEEFDSPEIGERFVERLRQGMQKGFIRTDKDVKAFLTDIRGTVADITLEINADQKRSLEQAHEEALRLNKEFDADLQHQRDAEFTRNARRLAAEADQWESWAKEVHDINVRLTKQIQAERDEEFDRQHRRMAEAIGDLDELESAYERLRSGTFKFSDSVESSQRELTRLSHVLREVADNDDDVHRSLTRMRAGLITMTPRINRVNKEWNKFSDVIGRITGRGSRNNFLNFVGSVNRNIVRMVGGIIFGTARAGQSIANFIDEVRKGGIELKDFKDLGISAFKGIAGGIGTLVGAAAILSFIAASAGILSAALSGLAAVLTALVSSVAFAAAALPIALAPIVPLAAAVGTLIAAFQGLDEAEKKALGHDLKPLTNAFGDLADAAGDVLFQDVGKWARELAPLIERLQPGIVKVANAIRDTIGDAIDNAANSAKVEHFLDRLNTRTSTHMAFLATATRKLGEIFTNVMEGMAGVFLAMLPSVNRFLGWLRDITQEFSDWANSKKGREELRDFFKKASDSAATLGDFLGAVTKFLATIISQSREAGDELFVDMTNAIRDVIKWLNSSEGKQAMDDWMTFARDFGHALGELVKGAINLFDALDSPATREALLDILGVITDIANFAGDHPDILGALFSTMAPIVQGVSAIVKGIGAVKDGLGNIGKGQGSEAEKIWNTADAIRQANLNTDDWRESAKTLRDTLDQVTGATTQATRAMALQQLQGDGLLKTGHDLGISSRTLVDAALGHRKALQEVTSAIFRQDDSFAGLNSVYQTFREKLGITAADLKRWRNQIQNNTQATQDFKGKLKGLPTNVKMFIRAEGIKPSIKGIAEVVREAKALAPNLKRRDIKTIIAASGEKPTIKNLRAVLDWVKKLNKSEAAPKIKPNTDPFEQARGLVERGVRGLSKETAKPGSNIDLKGFNADEKHMRSTLIALDRLQAKPSATILTQEFEERRQWIINSLASIPDAHVKVIVDRVNGVDSTGGNGGTDNGGGNGTDPRVVVPQGRASITVPSVTIVETADGKATAQELLNRLAALAY